MKRTPLKRKSLRKTRQEARMERWHKLIVKMQGECAICGCTINLCGHHIIGKATELERYSIDNGLCVCNSTGYGHYGCHQQIHDGVIDIDDYVDRNEIKEIIRNETGFFVK
jgi:hypothetical protein